MFYLITAHYTTGFEHKLSDNNYRHINAQIKQNWTSLTKKKEFVISAQLTSN